MTDENNDVCCCLGIIIVISIILVFSCIFHHTSDNSSNKEISESEYKNQCSSIDYDLFEKNPEKYRSQKLVMEGEVGYITEDNSGGYITLYVNGNGNDSIAVTYDGTNDILEDDYIIVYGTGAGYHKDEPWSFNDIPWIEGKYISRIQKTR